MHPNELMCILEMRDDDVDCVELANDEFLNHLADLEVTVFLGNYCKLAPESKRDYSPMFNGLRG